MMVHHLAGANDAPVLDRDKFGKNALPDSPFEQGAVLTNLKGAAAAFGQLQELGLMSVEQYKDLGWSYLGKAPVNPKWTGGLGMDSPTKQVWTPQLASAFAQDVMAKAKAAVSPGNLDWSNLPPLTPAQKQQVLAIVDGFKSKEDVAAWHKANVGKVDGVFLVAVLGAADQRKLIDMTASLGIRDDIQRSIEWAKAGFSTSTTPPTPPTTTPTTTLAVKQPMTAPSGGGWLLPVGIAAAAFLALRK